MTASMLELGAASQTFADAWDRFEASDGIRRLWARDSSLWTDRGEDQWLGWLDLPATPAHVLETYTELARSAHQDAVRHVVVMGMGGSSLCPDVLAQSFAPAAGQPTTLVLDSTVPAQIARVARQLDWSRSWFLVPSKSGGTIEPNCLLAFFHERAVRELGEAEAGARFLAITDAGSSLESVARERGFRAIVPGVPSVGGRFSALSAFGLLPAALQGIDVADWLARAARMADACGPDAPAAANPGAQLGVAIAALAAAGRDKLTLAISPGLAALGAWIEQLVAESTGKHGAGVVPIVGEALPDPEQAGDDRLFVYTRLQTAPDTAQDAAIDALAAAGQPIVRIDVADPRDLAAEIFRWEFATAPSGAVLGLNPFDQPDVESAKLEARSLMAAYERDGSLPQRKPLLRADAPDGDGTWTLYADPGLGDAADLDSALRHHFARAGRGDYLANNAHVDMSEANAGPLARLRHTLGRRLGIATTLGYGPRFLHSTGQLHKGGPGTGIFLQLTADDAEDLPIPGQRYSFGVLAQAQAQGDFAVLCERGRRALHIHLPADTTTALERLADRVERVLSTAS